MASEEFTIRITRKGEILIEVEGMPARRVKDLLTYFEERVGPVRQVESEGGDNPASVRLEDEIIREAGQDEEAARERGRLRE